MYLYTGIRFTTLLCLSKYMYQIYNIALLWLLLNIHLYYLQRLFPHSMYKTFYFCRQKWNQCVHTPNAQVPVLHTYRVHSALKGIWTVLNFRKKYYQSRQHTMSLPHILIRLFFIYTRFMFIECPYNVENLRTNYIIVTV